MSTLTRNDGAEFVMQAYRELVSANKKKFISQRVRMLAEQHGQFVRLLKKGYASYEVIFSRDAGYLFGESIKQYFGQLQNLIFCETLPNSSDVLLVVIRGGNVYLDTLVAAKNIRAELMPLLTEQKAYDVIISGTVPLQQAPANDAFCLPPESVHSFEMLDAPLFPRLPLIRGLQLLPLPLALKAEHLNDQTSSLAIIFLTLFLLASLGYWIFSSSENISGKPDLHNIASSYQVYNQALATPAPPMQLDELFGLINVLYTLPGWQAVKIHYENQQYQITVASLGSDFDALSQWAQQQGFIFQLTPHAALLMIHSHLLARPKPIDIYAAQSVLTTVIDQLDNVLHEKNITLTQPVLYNSVTEAPFAIHLTNTSPQTLLLIGGTLQDLPITINHIELNLKSGIISGTINLSVWGK